jgi:hypothetical protein
MILANRGNRGVRIRLRDRVTLSNTIGGNTNLTATASMAMAGVIVAGVIIHSRSTKRTGLRWPGLEIGLLAGHPKSRRVGP